MYDQRETSMIVSQADLYIDYAEVNEIFELLGDRALSNDKNIEDPALIVGVRKWTWNSCDEKGPDFSHLGFEMSEHVVIHDKYDVFIYTR